MQKNSDALQLKVSNVYKDFGAIQVLKNVSFTFNAGASVAITGPSGSGKSTLLHIIGTLEAPSRGHVEINNTDPFVLSEPELARYRNAVLGFVFQEHYLLPQYSVLENVLIPTLAFKKPAPTGTRTPLPTNPTQRARELLQRVGLTDRMSHRPAELSGGERQRVAIARALINHPSILLCDEPTGNLDTVTADTITNLLFDLHSTEQNILIVVTHNLELAARFQNHLKLADGILKA